VTGIAPDDLVVAPFIYSDMSCPHCRHGSTISCLRGGNLGNGTIDGGQGEAVCVPLAGRTLAPVPGDAQSDETLKSLLSLGSRAASASTPRWSALEPSGDRHGRGHRPLGFDDRVLDFETDLEGTPEAYAAMDERRAIKSMIRVSAP
jgi:hypothetical protein